MAAPTDGEPRAVGFVDLLWSPRALELAVLNVFESVVRYLVSVDKCARVRWGFDAATYSLEQASELVGG